MSRVVSSLSPQPISREVLQEKYAKGTETTADEVRLRVAHALAAVEPEAQRAHWTERFAWAQAQGFVPAGRIASAAGTTLGATLINCFVQPVGDSIAEPENGFPGIYTALTEAAETMRRGGGVGYDFSRIRPQGAWVGSTDSHASGPVSYMRVFDRSCETVESAGSRRGAQMGVLRCDHPDIEAFIHAKDSGDLRNFNVSVGVTNEFMRAVEADGEIDLTHRAEPGRKLKTAGAFERADGLWVYRRVRARHLWDQIMRSTYDHAEPGILFIDRINEDNNLGYCEAITATNPCGEQPLPSYGCCCLGSVDLTRFVRNPFAADAAFDEAGFAEVCAVATRMLDNVLDATVWPLPAQQREAMNKRRIGLGFTGLGDALIMLGRRYDTEPAREMARRISAVMRDAAYGASVELAKERGAFPLFDADRYLGGESFASRLPDELKDRIYAYGLRNSHLLSIAPTGTISLAFADNASNGIEPPFSWTYTRRKREADGSFKEYAVEDHAWRLYRHLHGPDAPLTDAFVTALDMSAEAHEAMVAAVAPYVDTSISKTVNVPADYPYAEFQGLYFTAWKSGLKGLATYRPNSVLGAVLSVEPAAAPAPAQVPQPQPLTVAQPGMTIDQDGANRRLRVERLPQPVLASLRWPGRPELPSGNPAWSYMIQHPHGSFSLFVGELPAEAGPDAGLFGQTLPFEVWVNGAEQPRGLGALAKTLSMDMRANDPSWLRLKLDALATVAEERAFDMAFPPTGEKRLFPGVVAATAAVIRWRCEQLGALQEGGATPVLDAMFSREEPRTGVDGTLAWAVDIENPGTGEQFTLTLKEVTLPTPEGGHVTRPCAIGFAGNYPRALDGLARLLSLDMRVIDPAWIGMKLRKLLNVGEPLGHFMAPVPGLPAGQRRQKVWPSTVAYVARLVIHRYAMLGVLDEEGYPVNEMGVLATPVAAASAVAASTARATMPGKPCPECGNATMIHKDGCEFCTSCGYVGACG
ncbi:adenosylcobalamin-dependent ribonucleoside-diphosphate reductase [Sphaerotilus montanus]|uniref:Vitamin B12-dependent ribonucleotide reductase n=1 Tax=Sphaerotilus montanus TaxID=522889 RepID=A0A7Y9QVA6_9BURK|nr:adenosylcobalamin-dependent ribonucleoside-diphosphate reductase [Sphaerotilus montanus]NYG32065.1 ribonucleoside-diphosphate reductase alpha chain [Sphaerotilus montanus]NZD59179.1 adenosylcobalamin-dependent ribonucleoside-diphosphate reductase [Sphaerotilus montanus]